MGVVVQRRYGTYTYVWKREPRRSAARPAQRLRKPALYPVMPGFYSCVVTDADGTRYHLSADHTVTIQLMGAGKPAINNVKTES